MLRTANDQATLWELILPAELLVLPPEPLGVDALPHDAVFFALFAPYFDARMGRPRGDPSAVLTVLTDRTAVRSDNTVRYPSPSRPSGDDVRPRSPRA